MPRIPGGGSHFPHFHLPWHFSGDSDIGMYCAIGLGALVLIGVGLLTGVSLGRWWRGVLVFPQAAAASPTAGPQSVPPMQDLIISPDEVIDKSLKTTRLLLSLARTQPPFNPEPLREWIRNYFYQVQYCWQQRDPAPVSQSMTPQALARYEKLIRVMRRNRQINRVDDLQVRRLEFVHVFCPHNVEQHEVTVLITFEARAHYVHETTGAFIGGAQKNTWYQEFWTFQRYGDSWRLHQVQQSWADSHLADPNRVDGLSEEELQNVENGAILL
jgi:hypothetical protein